MKKLICAILAVVLCLSLTACAGKPAESKIEKGPYTDGTYEVNDAEYSHGWKEYVIITVTDGNIASVEFDGKNEAGEKKSGDAAYKESMTAYGGTTYPEKFFPEIVENYMAAGSLETMESVAGATSSSDAFKELMAKAL
ncbi:MAG: FMN-binding protein, partial [Oscillospiraceae bacterium]|nr:FMN-binding protein [Oscillospiraceae bacterium]